MQGLKNVRNRRSDALTHVGWNQLEVMLAIYYRGQGYAVDHCGTGASGTQFDGGIDLKLRKDDAYILVQCKHWNAKQVPHNAVHELMGVMINESATGAILVTSGEFTRAAIEAATKQGHVRLVDGDDLRAMLGPLPSPATSSAGAMEAAPEPLTHRIGTKAGKRFISSGATWAAPGLVAHRTAATVGERLLSAAEDRIRYGHDRSHGRGRGVLGMTAKSALTIVLVKIVFALLMVMIFVLTVQSVVGNLVGSLQLPSTTPATRAQHALPAPSATGDKGVLGQADHARGRQPEVIDHYTGTTIEDESLSVRAAKPMSAAELRERQRQADEAARIIEASTPEM